MPSRKCKPGTSGAVRSVAVESTVPLAIAVEAGSSSPPVTYEVTTRIEARSGIACQLPMLAILLT